MYLETVRPCRGVNVTLGYAVLVANARQKSVGLSSRPGFGLDVRNLCVIVSGPLNHLSASASTLIGDCAFCYFRASTVCLKNTKPLTFLNLKESFIGTYY